MTENTKQGDRDLGNVDMDTGVVHANDQATAQVTADDMAAQPAPETIGADDQGRRLLSFVSPRDFADQQWCIANVGSKPRGYHVSVGRIAGYALKTERRPSGLPVKPGEKPLPDSVWIGGEFEATNTMTGEVRAAAWLILPRAAGNLIEAAFASGAERALLDLEIGVEATGRAIPYAWTVTAYGTRQTEAQRVVDAIKARQEARIAARRVAGGVASLTATARLEQVREEHKDLLEGRETMAEHIRRNPPIAS